MCNRECHSDIRTHALSEISGQKPLFAGAPSPYYQGNLPPPLTPTGCEDCGPSDCGDVHGLDAGELLAEVMRVAPTTLRSIPRRPAVSTSTDEAARIQISSVRIAAGEVPDSLCLPAALSSSEPVPSSYEPPTPDSMPQKSTSSSSRSVGKKSSGGDGLSRMNWLNCS